MALPTYRVTEILYTLQGEGKLAGTPMVLVRFAGCNLACTKAVEGFDCDTPLAHAQGHAYTTEDLLAAVGNAWYTNDPALPGVARKPRWLLLTGGEPTLQVDADLLQAMRGDGWLTAMETNGTRPVPQGVDWVTVSPKPGARVVVRECDEVKYVCRAGQYPTQAGVLQAAHTLISPAFEEDGTLLQATIDWCVNLVKGNPDLCLSVQIHKLLRVP